ncbi:uncharacterized protein [Asterias amurensis]|uniref:uncharacterized protein isoform X1 n=2 Tax=Asterias amurensis TaxID=7602 RepID=UPI003AB49840
MVIERVPKLPYDKNKSHHKLCLTMQRHLKAAVHQKAGFPDTSEVLLKEGWCVKKSGNKGLLGQYKWQRRWFILLQRGQTVTLYYYEKQGARSAKGQIQLSNKYVTREPEGKEREQRNCFEVGPFAEDGTTRTYYISCETEEDKHEWMEVMNAAIEGSTAKKALERKQTASFNFKKRQNRAKVQSMHIGRREIKRDLYLDPDWRKLQWKTLVELASSKDWKKSNTKDGITVGRKSFSDGLHAVVKIEGIIQAKCKHVYSFLQSAVKPGGKLDFPFKNVDDVLEELSSPPRGVVVSCYKDLKVLPNTQPRHVTLLQMAVPMQLTQGESCGLLVMSVHHPDCEKRPDAVACSVGISGCVIKEHKSEQQTSSVQHASSDETDPTDNIRSPRSHVTHMTLLCQVNLQGSLQAMMKGAYRSGLLVYGMRSFFQNLTDHIDNYVKIVDF